MFDIDQRLHISTTDDPAGTKSDAGQSEGRPEGEPINHRAMTGLNEAALCEMQHRLLDSEENERQRLAQELHDGPLQELHSLDFKLVAMARQIADDQQQAQLSEMRSTLRQLARHLPRHLPRLASTGTHAVWCQCCAAVVCRIIPTESSRPDHCRRFG